MRAEAFRVGDVCVDSVLEYTLSSSHTSSPRAGTERAPTFFSPLPSNTAQWWLGNACWRPTGMEAPWVWVFQSRCQSDWRVIVPADSWLRATALLLRRNITHWPLRPHFSEEADGVDYIYTSAHLATEQTCRQVRLFIQMDFKNAVMTCRARKVINCLS